MAEAKLAFIGGSGLYDLAELTDRAEVDVDTPYGPPSDAIIVGSLGDVRVSFLPRHGGGHRITPSELPARANIYALKSLGVERIVSVSAVGSLKESIRPLDFVVPDQLIDRTKSRPATFFEDGIVGHVAFADPFCPDLSRELASAAFGQGATTHEGGTCVVIEGPQFSTRAESRLYQSWDADIIGMTALPEAKLAREAEMCYATLACVTDYDTWHVSEEDVTVEVVIANLHRNVSLAQSVIRAIAPVAESERHCECGSALANAIVTARERVPEDTLRKLGAIVQKYL